MTITLWVFFGLFVALWTWLIVDAILNEEEWLADSDELDKFWESNT